MCHTSRTFYISSGSLYSFMAIQHTLYYSTYRAHVWIHIAVRCTAPFLAYSPSHTHTPSSTKFLGVMRTGQELQQYDSVTSHRRHYSECCFQVHFTRSPQDWRCHALASELAHELAALASGLVVSRARLRTGSRARLRTSFFTRSPQSCCTRSPQG